jgi:hypothetical protein
VGGKPTFAAIHQGDGLRRFLPFVWMGWWIAK